MQTLLERILTDYEEIETNKVAENHRAAEWCRLYDEYVTNFTEEETDYCLKEIKPTTPVIDGIQRNAVEYFGDFCPPHVRSSIALQNRFYEIEFDDVIYDPQGGNFITLNSHRDYVRYGREKGFEETLKPVMKCHNIGYIGATRSFGNYYHWLVENMPKLVHLAQKYPEEIIFTHKSKIPCHEQYNELDGMGLKVEENIRTAFFQKAITTTVTTNFIPAYRLSKHVLPAKEILAFPRMVKDSLKGKTRRVFISRRDAKTRVLRDEADLISQLEARGFDCPTMSELSLSEQIELCSNAEIIISTHGAGLSNMLYRADQECKIVEIVPAKKWPHNNLICMYNLSQTCGFDHYVYDCGYESDDYRLLNQVWNIDNKQFLNFIDTILT